MKPYKLRNRYCPADQHILEWYVGGRKGKNVEYLRFTRYSLENVLDRFNCTELSLRQKGLAHGCGNMMQLASHDVILYINFRTPYH